jgi:hypothetical protein
MNNRNTVNAEGPAISAEQYRERIQYEDQLLYTRFNLVLVLNGLVAVAVGFNQPIYSKILLAVVMVVINALGAIAIWKTELVIANLTRRLLQDHRQNELESIVQRSLGKPRWLRPNQILCRIFPVVLTLGWLCGLALALGSLF